MSSFPAEKGMSLPTVGPETKTTAIKNRRLCLAKHLRVLTWLILTVVFFQFGWLYSAPYTAREDRGIDSNVAKDVCPQPDALVPSKNEALWKTLGSAYETGVFELQAISWLSGAVRVP